MQWQTDLRRLGQAGMATGTVAVEVKVALARDLERCEERIRAYDESWVNKLNLKRAVAEKVHRQTCHARRSYMHANLYRVPCSCVVGVAYAELSACSTQDLPRVQDEAAEVRARVEVNMQRLHVELMIFIHEKSEEKYQELLQATKDEAAQLRANLTVQKKILREIQDGQDGDAKAVQTHIDEVEYQIGIVGSMQKSTLAQIHAGFKQVLSEGQQHFDKLSEQNVSIMKKQDVHFEKLSKATLQVLAEMQDGFGNNAQLHRELRTALNTTEGTIVANIDQRICALVKQGQEWHAKQFSMMVTVLTALGLDGPASDEIKKKVEAVAGARVQLQSAGDGGV